MAETPTPTATHTDNPFMEPTANTALLQFQYHNPVQDSNLNFPEGMPIDIIYVDDGRESPHSANPLQIGANGQLRFELEHRGNMYFSFEFEEAHYMNITSSTATLMSETELNQALQDQSFDTTSDMAFMLPRAFTLQNARWIIGGEGAEVPVYNAEERMFWELENNVLQGGDGGYLPVILNPEWQYIGFEYIGRQATESQMVPQFLFLRGYNEQFSEDEPATVSNVYRDNCICLPWIEDRNLRETRHRRRIALKFGTAEAYIESGAMVRRTADAVRAMAFTNRLRFYDLPTEWTSANWKAKIGAYGTLEAFGEANIVNGETTPTSPLIFELDTIVLTDEDCEWISSWDEDNRFTIFDLAMNIANPDSNKPYLTDGTIESNFFPMENTIDTGSGSGSPEDETEEESTDSDEASGGGSITSVIPVNTDESGDTTISACFPRLIAVNGEFYDVTDKRSTGELIGARAAIRDDAQVHYGEALRSPVVQGAGNFELHYLTDCLDSSYNLMPALLIYWSCDFQRHSPADASDVNNFHREGMTNSKERWETKDYLFFPIDDSSNVKVKPVFFFEGRTERPRKCHVHINRRTDPNARSGMALEEAYFMTDDYQSRVPKGTAEQDVDNNSYGRFVMTHELGHAVGLYDEYIESLTQDNKNNVKDITLWNPPLPMFDQYYPGMPYSYDDISMMKSCRTPRLRHFWYFCRWLNKTEEVTNLTNETTFKVYHSGRDYSYTLIADYQNFYDPAFSEENIVNNTFGNFDLFLYKIGDDETTDRLITTQSDFDSILVVRTKIQWFFEDNTPGRWMDISSKLMQMRNFQTALGKEMNGKYYLQRSDSGSEFDKVYVYFVPHYHFEGGASGQHFIVRVNTTGTQVITPNFFADNFADNELEFDENLGSVCIYRYMLGLVPYRMSGDTKVERNTITLDELDFLETWIEDAGRCGGSYTISQ